MHRARIALLGLEMRKIGHGTASLIDRFVM